MLEYGRTGRTARVAGGAAHGIAAIWTLQNLCVLLSQQVPEFELDFSAVRRNDFSTHAKKGKVALGLMAAGDMASAGAHMSPAVGLFRSLSGVSPS